MYHVGADELRLDELNFLAIVVVALILFLHIPVGGEEGRAESVGVQRGVEFNARIVFLDWSLTQVQPGARNALRRRGCEV